MSELKQEPEKKSGNTWWIAGAALVLGYYVGQGEKPAQSTTYAETPAPILTPADESAADEAVDEALEAAADAVASAGEAVEEADASEYITPEADQAEYAYASDPVAPSDDGGADDTPSAGSVAAVVGATTVASSNGPWSRYQSSDTSTATQPTTSNSSGYQPSTGYASTYRPRATYVPPAGTYSAPKCESTGCYGVISTTTGLPRTNYVSGYYRKDGTYVRPYYRSRRN